MRQNASAAGALHSPAHLAGFVGRGMEIERHGKEKKTKRMEWEEKEGERNAIYGRVCVTGFRG